MSHDWDAFRSSLEWSGVVFPDDDAATIPRIYKQNRNRWQHIRRMVLLVQKKYSGVVASAQLDIDQVFQQLLLLTKKTNFVLYEIDELLEILYELDQLEGAFDFEKGSSAAYLQRIKQAFAVAKTDYGWRKGHDPEDFRPSFLIGEPPKIPRKSEE